MDYRTRMAAYMAAKGAGRPKEELRLLWQAVEETYGQGGGTATKERKAEDYAFCEKEVARNRRTVSPGCLTAFSRVHHGPMNGRGERVLYTEPAPLPRSVY